MDLFSLWQDRLVLKSGQSHQRESIRTTIDGNTIHVLEKISPYKDENGNIIGIFEDFRDISPIKENEEKLKEAQKVLTIVNKHLQDKIQEKTKNSAVDAKQLVECFDQIPKKYFQKDKVCKYVNANDLFLKEKPKNGYRIFVMGGSTAAGYPYGENLMFSRILNKSLSVTFPEKKIEVINTYKWLLFLISYKALS